MVLEEATSPQEPATYSENAPTSDLDPYATNTTQELSGRPSSYIRIDQPGNNPPLYVNAANLPQPIAVFFKQRRAQEIERDIKEVCQYVGRAVQRPLRQEEADALAYHHARSVRIASYGSPLGAAVATLWAYRQTNFRFPGWSPMATGRFSPDSLGPLKGQLARTTWTIARYNAYGFVGIIFGSMFTTSYAISSSMANRAMDPRLKDFMEALKAKASGKTVERRSQSEGRMEGETFEMARQRKAVSQQQQRVQQQPQQDESWQQKRRSPKQGSDDMSPTSGGFEDDFMDAGNDTGLMSDGRANAQQQRAENATSTYDMSAPSSSSSSPQSRPQNANASAQSKQGSSTSNTGGSVWERLRQNAMSGNTPPPNSPSSPSARAQPSRAPIQNSQPSGSDSFSFSRSEEESQLARSEAQKEFDKRVEQEREGHDFSEGRGGGGKAGKW